MNKIEQLTSQILTSPENIEFNDVMKMIDDNYHYQPGRFINNETTNEAGTNEGSCKIFAFAKLHNLTKNQTLSLFGQYYRTDVLQHPNGTDHLNIRNFLRAGWEGIQFDNQVLSLKA